MWSVDGQQGNTRGREKKRKERETEKNMRAVWTLAQGPLVNHTYFCSFFVVVLLFFFPNSLDPH